MVEPVFEMLWDCRYCSTKKLLGLTHRHCPSCGAQQDPNARYFPAEHEKVAVGSHEYVGADLKCRYCGNASSRKAHNCYHCGAPLSEAEPVQAQQTSAPVGPAPASSALVGGAPTPPRSALRVVVPVLLLALTGLVALLLVWKREQAFVVADTQWQRSIAIERFGPVERSAWCDELPAGARELSRKRAQRDTKKVPDGEDCRKKQKDRGDGTFVEEQVCTPKYKQEPVYDQKCEFSVNEWAVLREEKLAGSGVAQPPRWPSATLSRPACVSVGCEREGVRQARYTVVFKDKQAEAYRCDLDEKPWASYAVGQRYAGKVRALVGSLDCASLAPAR